MIKKLMRWFLLIIYRRKALALLAQYDSYSESPDRTVWMGTFYQQQRALVDSIFFDKVYIQTIKNEKIFIYDTIDGTVKMFQRFLEQLEKNSAIHTHELREFLNNSRTQTLHSVYRNDLDLRSQLIPIQQILDEVIESYSRQGSSFKMMNLSRILPLFEMYALLVNRSIKGVINGE